MTEIKKFFLIILLGALVIKLFLFIYAELYAPEAKIQIDTAMYLESGMNLVSLGKFARRDGTGVLQFETLRTPGYSLFLGLLHGLMKIPLSGIILIQIFLTILVAFITYKTALHIEPRLACLSTLIVLYDPPITIFSLMLLTETLFLLLISLFMFIFTLYLKEKRIKFIVLSALIVAMATYVRPINYFLGVTMVFFIIYVIMRTGSKKFLNHTLIFLIIVYSLIGVWQLRNYRVCRKYTFTTFTHLASSYRETIRDDDVITQSLPTIPYYLNAASRCVMSLMTSPGSLKNFNSPTLKFMGKILAYPWMVFWLIGFLVGISKVENNFYLQFLLFIVLYFICASVGGILFGVSSRMRVPMVPFIAILSANGWLWLDSLFKK